MGHLYSTSHNAADLITLSLLHWLVLRKACNKCIRLSTSSLVSLLAGHLDVSHWPVIKHLSNQVPIWKRFYGYFTCLPGQKRKRKLLKRTFKNRLSEFIKHFDVISTETKFLTIFSPKKNLTVFSKLHDIDTIERYKVRVVRCILAIVI